VISVHNLAKTFTLHNLGGKCLTACQGVSFAVSHGSFLGLSGPSGAGKSTVLKCLYRTYLPEQGAIRYCSATFGEVDLATLPDRAILELRQREIGYVSQFLKVIPRVSALEVVMEPMLRQNGLAREEARRRAGGLLERLRIPPRLFDAYPATFSGGEQQRVNIARAIGWKPRLLLLDEPTASLDQHSAATVLGLLAELRAEGATMIGIFHDQELLATVADDVYRIA
jgi:alpha-D-ribose 1-methylphosphonate 5-triphosphate synthase subunit PhnL